MAVQGTVQSYSNVFSKANLILIPVLHKQIWS